ncbi:uncharacterized protein LAESUDRAFT_815280 [Laetiporus sulphureus 93-53]|uniref:Homeobox domain-containing protein n=1 Tax=Laetiporus sulphureus 93-53 TaxID=1314785 RepID=A0A165C9C4_9APHY|nr:uncharacterized protein LAESUDRAFT_815280 [Laetiporus sulphureus 93-53]KZT02426.1 hypothetical protein LAESUDRAFT_815280 [Laetiporus sulphureus 93-53]
MLTGLSPALDLSSFSNNIPDKNVTTQPKGEIPFARRRLQHDQTIALLAVFEEKTHPTKEERTALAEELGIELKTVSAWFQNRRRTIKKRAAAWKRCMQENLPDSKGNMSRQGSRLSLDCIVSSRERPTAPDIPSLPQPPLTPHRINLRMMRRPITPLKQPKKLWEYIPSSPPAPPSSPTADSQRLAALPKSSRTLRSLEWACAKARAEKKVEGDADEDLDVPQLVLDGETRGGQHDGNDTEVEDHEAITPDNSICEMVTYQSPFGALGEGTDEKAPSVDMEAAMALLGFMGKRSVEQSGQTLWGM